MKHFIGFQAVIILLFLINSALCAQNHEVRNVSFKPVEQNTIIINYDLIGENKPYNVKVVLKRKNRANFSYSPDALIGDVGNGRHAGYGKKIIWNLDGEDSELFTLDNYNNDYYFEVSATRRYGQAVFWVLVLGTAGVLGFIYNPF